MDRQQHRDGHTDRHRGGHTDRQRGGQTRKEMDLQTIDELFPLFSLPMQATVKVDCSKDLVKVHTCSNSIILYTV